ncbi:MAG: transporter substrate-binding domain-containing protein, partial [Caldicoprobacterales bacterium]
MKNRCVYEPFAKKISKSYKECGLLKAFQNKLCLFLSFALLLVLFAITTSPCLANEDMLIWTEQELSFMKNHPIIRLGVDPNFVPFEFIDEHGSYKGIAADYLAIVSEKTGLEFEIIDLPWPEAYDMALAGEVDALPAIGKTSERQEHFLFSEPYYYYKRVIVTRDIDTNINSIDDLEGYTVAVQRNSSHHSYLLDYPKINLSLYDSVEAALTDVATGTEKAFIGNLATTNYLIRSTGLNNLRFISFEAEKQQALHFAVRKDFPELISIFNKALSSVTDSERLAINNKWIELDTSPDYGPIYRLLSIAGAIITIIFLVSVFWITRLRKEIKQRKLIQVDLEQSKLEADLANEYKSRFMARMSHEIRTPLNAIMGISYLLKNTDLTLTQSMYTDRITQASNSMLSIINDILDYSKLEAGKVELEMTSFNMDQVIQD